MILTFSRLASCLKSQLVVAFVLKLAGLALLFLMHLVLARRLGSDAYGIISYALAAVGMLSVLASFGLPTGSMRFVAEYRERGHWELLRGILLSSAGIVWGGSLLASLAVWTTGELLIEKESLRDSLRFTALLVPFVSYGLWRAKVMRGLDRIDEAILPQEVLVPALVTIIVWFGPQVTAPSAVLIYFGCLVATESVGTWWLLRRIPTESRIANAKYRLRQWIRVSRSMLLGSLMQTGLNRTDVLLLGIFATMEATGIYYAASRLAFLCSFGLRVVDAFVPPKIAAAYFGGRMTEVRRIVFFGIALSLSAAVPIALPLLLWPESLLGLFGAEFVQGAPVLAILAFGQLINAATGPVAFALLMTGNERAYAQTQLIATLANLGANALLIPVWGAVGAAIATTASTVLLNATLFVQAWHILELRKFAPEPSGSPENGRIASRVRELLSSVRL